MTSIEVVIQAKAIATELNSMNHEYRIFFWGGELIFYIQFCSCSQMFVYLVLFIQLESELQLQPVEWEGLCSSWVGEKIRLGGKSQCPPPPPPPPVYIPDDYYKPLFLNVFTSHHSFGLCPPITLITGDVMWYKYNMILLDSLLPLIISYTCIYLQKGSLNIDEEGVNPLGKLISNGVYTCTSLGWFSSFFMYM